MGGKYLEGKKGMGVTDNGSAVERATVEIKIHVFSPQDPEEGCHYTVLTCYRFCLLQGSEAIEYFSTSDCDCSMTLVVSRVNRNEDRKQPVPREKKLGRAR